nr:Acyl CoA:acetate/3-ketoacid CoA transferase [Klebsiella pneumoniae]
MRKFVAGVNQISYNGELARAKGQTMHYVTERAVFELRPEGPVLTEIAPVSILSATSRRIWIFIRRSPRIFRLWTAECSPRHPAVSRNICPGIHPLTHKERCYETWQ